ncbi:MAG: UDP-N-acetylenolpyruvoylglucosamine reductase [uncultured Acidimicrobiales bacterium]|uniref:UDP-N-acetylenolpyruvoylglucosamine reductase n=1 Tax=uncultured Acidimicrobiales bacterium TaxID=310071 RepID=A0A6J4J709_9ACTN|nr:MAG: UDP-N-acetylenolpyruvoylglucosamine reductase [uncultured Acidimicrobiales bacterium]
MSSSVERAAELLGHAAERDVALGPFTTYRVGGPASLLLRAASEPDLALARKVVVETGVRVLVVGKGSNLLVADSGFAGLAVILGDGFSAIEIRPDGLVVAGAATSLPVLARRTAAAGLTGFEWAVGVPGTVGGAVRMNAGGHGSDMAASLVSWTSVDLAGGPDGRAPAATLELRYRHSSVRPTQVVTSAELQLASGDRAESETQISEIVRWRREHQPGGQNAGSIFTNPPDASAGQLIDRAGLRGHRRGSAHVSPKHANFFQADEGGSADDVRSLILEVQQEVEARTGVRLEPELRMVGFEPIGGEPSTRGRG